MNTLDFRDTLARAGWTFVQTFLSVVLVGGQLALDSTTLKAGVLAAVAAVLVLAKQVAQAELARKRAR